MFAPVILFRLDVFGCYIFLLCTKLLARVFFYSVCEKYIKIDIKINKKSYHYI